MKPDLSLYLIADIEAGYKYPFLKVIEEAILGGVTIVQLRVKNKTKAEFLQSARAMRSLTKSYRIPFIINDDIEVTLAVDADGVHLGQSDIKITEARKILGPNAIIGVSTHNIEEALEAEKKGANYAGVGTVFPTTSKTDIRGIIGVAGLTEVRNKVKLPLVGIGGINLSNVASVVEAGIDGVAVISAIMSSNDPKKTAKEFKAIIDGLYT